MTAARRPWYRPMVSRRPDEEHRTASPLELFFDLCFVVAVALAADSLHENLVEGHPRHGILGYLSVFFAIWWAWMNFTWFASAYDTDDDLYRVTTLVQIAGVLVLAAGVPRAFDGNFTVVTVGYVLMRLALVFQWLRASRGDAERHRTAVRYAWGVAIVQLGWLLRLLAPPTWSLFVLLVIAELAVPIWAERNKPTTPHPRHIAERYGLFTLIVLGESVLAATTAVQQSLDRPRVVAIAGAGLVIVFAMWWLYFDRPADDVLTSQRTAFLWGYGHYFVFASAGAVGAGLAVAVDEPDHAGWAVALPVAVYVLSVWLIHVRRQGIPFVVAAGLILATPLTPAPVGGTALVLAALIGVTRYLFKATPQKSL